jgi:F-type H+-transporting ATPase subunit alpha
MADTDTQSTFDLGAQARAALQTLASAAGELALTAHVDRVGVVERVGDGIATVSTIPGVGFAELLRFPGDVYGMVFDLAEDRMGCVILGDDEAINAGELVYPVGSVLEVPVGDELIGRVVDPLGRPIDGQGDIVPDARYPVEREAPSILDRIPITTPLQTGSKAVDALIPVGRGQRELIVGDRAIGKTALAVDAIISQRDSDVLCVYVAIGQKTSAVSGVIASLKREDAMKYTVVVCCDANDAPGLGFIAPYAGCTIGEYFMEHGKDVLVIYDDLTKHAIAYRQLSLLLRRPPGREAYPGDIFFIHSRLLERATRLVKEKGGGSLTALPIVETQAGNMSAYIPTNLISITDGQIYLDPSLFHKGIKPAVNIGKSVSRVGGKTQLPAVKQVAKNLRLEYTQFEELEVFTRFGAKVEEATQKKIDRGRRIREILKQPRFQPMKFAHQVLVLLSIQHGVFDDVELADMAALEAELIEAAAATENPALKKATDGEKLEDKDIETLLALANDAKRRWADARPERDRETDRADQGSA